MSDSWMAWKPRIDEPSNIWPVGEEVLVDRLSRHVEVLHDTGQVAEADVDELDVLVLDETQDLVRVAEHSSSLGGGDGRAPASGLLISRRYGGRGFPSVTRVFPRCYASAPAKLAGQHQRSRSGCLG